MYLCVLGVISSASSTLLSTAAISFRSKISTIKSRIFFCWQDVVKRSPPNRNACDFQRVIIIEIEKENSNTSVWLRIQNENMYPKGKTEKKNLK